MNASDFYNTQHSPIGAFASFTLGAKGPRGGFGLEIGKPADEHVLIGLENREDDSFSYLPFCQEILDDSSNFDLATDPRQKAFRMDAFADEAITRTLTPATDTWVAGDLTFTIHTPVGEAPPPSAPRAVRELAYAPALAVEITVDNRQGRKPRRCFFGFQSNDPMRHMRRLDDTAPFPGLACGLTTAIASNTPGVWSAQAFTCEQILAGAHDFNRGWGLGRVGLLVGTTPAGKTRTFRFAVCFHRAGIVTTGMPASYHYYRFFKDLESVASYALKNFPALKNRGAAFNRRFLKSKLSPERKFMLAQALHSYYGSTQFLDIGKESMWIVNEGEYRMINTFDLTVDQLFLEMEFHPWTVANELDWFTKRYAYRDKVRLPGSEREFPGGLSFAHDMGMANHFSVPGRSVYEKAGLHGCFSHMTHEELVNWLVCGLVYQHHTGDKAWTRKNLPVFRDCLDSLLRRDHPDAARRDGLMSADSSRCQGGSEITTYDSLDVSLGQARNNLYLAVKTWGVYTGLEHFFARQKDPRRAALCREQALRAAATLTASADADGLLPAVINENVTSRIIPAIEGLVIPWSLGLKEALDPKGPHGPLLAALKRHLQGVLRPGLCRFPDGGWKISSTSDNSWLSKIYLCQFIAESILGLEPDREADRAHAAWLQDARNQYWAWSDQMVAGEAKASKYYPRGVTSILWMS
ncbi:MAG: glycoside hydrolase family 52 protein [Candidatus Methylacidiphilales bacterium]|nr:glycoside hydrolase family 52 protein [Candidatus Methylacidiphilales bacterium]